MRLITHINPDLDAFASAWAVREFHPDAEEAQDAELVLKPANWDGSGMAEGDLALDIEAGGHGIKGEHRADGTVGSCFAAVMARYAAHDDQAALASLIEVVDAQDAHGSAVVWLAPEASPCAQTVLGDTGLNGVLRAFQACYPRNEALVLERMSEIFFGMLAVGRARTRAEAEADRAELVGDGRVAILRDSREFATTGILFDRGVLAIVLVGGDDDGRHNLRIIRRRDVALRMDDPALRAVVEAAGEEVGDGEGLWYPHPAGFYFGRGGPKAPASSPSRVHPLLLAWAAHRLLDNGPCWNCDWPSSPQRTYCSHCGADKRVPESNVE